MRPALVIGAGEVGIKHLAALAATPGVAPVGVCDPDPRAGVPPGLPAFTSWAAALTALSPALVVVATPPGVALTAARDAAASGAAVLVEKPVTTAPAALVPQRGDERIFVGFQTHFAPGLQELLTAPPVVDRAEVVLAVRRDPPYYRGWRSRLATAGGVLHQQAVHGLALGLRLLPGEVRAVQAHVVHRRYLSEIEDHVVATVTLAGGQVVHIDARVDHDGPPRHELIMHRGDGERVHVHGRNLEAGLGTGPALTDEELRRRLYTAVLAATDGHPPHPCLFPLRALRRPLEVIDRVYRDARVVRTLHAVGPRPGR